MTATLRSDPVDLAAGHLAAGRVAEAKAIYEQVLRAEPAHARALCGLGTIALRSGEVARAFELIGHAAAIAPGDGATIGSLAVAYLARNQLPEAEDCCRRALDLAPRLPELHANLANVLAMRGDTDGAIVAQRHAIGLDPDSAVQYFNLANILVARGRPEAAAREYKTALGLDPGHVGALNNLALLLKQAGDLDAAHELLDEAQLRDPLNPELLANQADLLLQSDRPSEALAAMRRAVGLSPQHPQLRASLGAMLLELGHLTEAGVELAAATRGAPSDSRIAMLLARLLRRQGRLDTAQTAADRAASLAGPGSPEDAVAGELLLLRGHYEDAWRRLAPLPVTGGADLNEPDLSPGTDLDGTAIRLVAMDAAASLFAARFLPALAERGAVLTILCPPPLATLLATVEGVADAVATPHLNLAELAADRQPTMCLDVLPSRLRATPQDPPSAVPVFQVRPEAGASGRRRIGLWWEGPGPGSALPESLAGLDAIDLVSLQNGAARDAALSVLERPGVVDRGHAVGDFRDLAAEIAALDVMIAPDGPVAHLAGSLGIETWVLGGRDGSWYWGDATRRSNWYPDSRVFQQSADRTWTSALAALRAALAPPADEAAAADIEDSA